LHNEEIHNLYPSLHIIGCEQIKEDEMMGHVARIGESRMLTKFWSQNLKCVLRK
jgi:hypothetical protein